MLEATLPYVQVVGAIQFAKEAHQGQERKCTGEPYLVHPFAVAGIVASVSDDVEMLMAALLHDTVEDTDKTLDDVEELFGARVRSLVADLTDISKHSDGSRKIRVAIDREHTKGAHPDAKTIKLADVANNLKNINDFDPAFARKYMAEKRVLLDEALQEGDPTLKKLVDNIIKTYYNENPKPTSTRSYVDFEFCKDIKCMFLQGHANFADLHMCSMDDCQYSADVFHRWLGKQGFFVLKIREEYESN